MPNVTTDLTTGRSLTQLLRFSVPLVLGSFVQQLYNFADTVVVGRLVGPDALGAVGATYALNFLVLGFAQGAGIGFGIPVAQRFGAHDEEGFRRYLWNGAWASAVLSIVLAVAMIVVARPLLVLLGTPADLLDMATIYIAIVFAGIPATLFYNYSAAVLRAVGDSRHPFIFLAISCVVNVGLDLVFILAFDMGVAGSALGDVLGTLLSVALNCWWAFSRVPWVRVERAAMAPSGRHLRRLCVIGLPMGFEYSVSAVGALAMQGAINSFGTVTVTAQTTGEKIRQLFTLPMESVGMAMATYVGQNHGAHRTDRIQQGIQDGCTIQLTYCVAAWVVIFFVKPYAVGLVLGDADPAVTAGAIQYLAIMSLLFCFHGLLMIFRNTLQGLGYSVQAIISGVGELIGRSLGGLLAVKTGLGYVGICLSNPFAWGLAMLYCMFMVRRMLKRED